jgi:hypothetical protein
MNTETQHTPGPWKISRHATPDYAPQYGVYTENNRHIATVRGEHAEEDARLVASAPELLAVVQRLFLSVNGLSATFSAVNVEYACSHLRKEIAETIREAQNALHKATGN